MIARVASVIAALVRLVVAAREKRVVEVDVAAEGVAVGRALKRDARVQAVERLYHVRVLCVCVCV